MEKEERLSIGNVTDEKLINIIGQLMTTYKKYVEGQVEMEPLEHTVGPPSWRLPDCIHQVLEEELNKPEYGPSVLKHLIQNSSLLGQVEHS